MAGRPRAPITIVEPHEILEINQISEENWTAEMLIPLLVTPEETMKWVARRRLLRNNMNCETCNQPCRLVNQARVIDGKIWKCRGCQWTKSIRHSSLFSRSHLELKRIKLVS